MDTIREIQRLPSPAPKPQSIAWDGQHALDGFAFDANDLRARPGRQWYPQKVLSGAGTVERVIEVPHGVCGQAIVNGIIYLVTTDDEDSTDYWLTRVDPRPAVPVIDDLRRIHFAARALAFDGALFWTNHREQDEIVSFAAPF